MSTQRDRQVLNSILNPNLPIGEGVYDPREDGSGRLEEGLPEEVKRQQRMGVAAAEGGDLQQAIQYFDKAIELAPESSSCYNNRAQAWRLLGRPDRAMSDLQEALRLSQGDGHCGAQAFCQRGLIHKKEGRDDLAAEDFRKAADLGSGFAKSVLVEMNPYAAMCNTMLRDVFTAMSRQTERAAGDS